MYDNRNGWFGPPGNPNYPSAPPPNNVGQRLARYAPQPQEPPSVIAGRIINDPSEITPDEVPMNGSLSVFPLQDLSCILAKAWTDQGIKTVCYVPEKQLIQQRQTGPTQVIIPQDFQNNVFQRLEAIEQALSKPSKAQIKKEEKPNG